MTQVVEQLIVHQRVRLEDAVIGLRHPELLGVADDQPLQPRKYGRLEPLRELRSFVREDVRGLSEDVLRDEVVTAPDAHVGAIRVARRVAGDVGPGAAEPDDEHALSRELFGAPVSLRVPEGAAEAPGYSGMFGSS